MNEGKSTMRNCSKAEKNKAGEIFVLPPNLLEELGIHLGTIETTRESTMECQESDKDTLSRRKRVGEPNQILSNYIENHHATTSETEPSIIRTANLMKESVLLSPTFNLNNASVQSELEIEENTHLGMKISKVDEYVLKSLEITEMGPPNLLPQPVSINDFENIDSARASISTKDMIKVDESSHVPDMTYADTKDTMYDEHADEAYSSDCSNSQIDKADVLNISDVQFSNESKINKNKKINIISEEIIHPTQFQNINKCCSPRGNNLIPVTMNTIIKSQYKNSICYGHTMNSNLCPDLITDCLKPTEKFDRKINKFSPETENTVLNKSDNAIQQNPEMIESIEKNESKQLIADSIQGNDKLIMETCSVDSVDNVDVIKTDVLIETCNNPISTVVMLKERNVNTTFKKVNAIPSDIKWDASEINSKYKNNENLTGAQYYNGDEISSSSLKCNGDAGNNSVFIKNNETEFNIKEQNIKNKTRISRKSPDGNTRKCTFQTKNNDAEQSGIEETNLKSEINTPQNETCRNITAKSKSKPESGKNADDVDLDKVKEIAKYLSQIAEIKKRKVMEMMNGRNTSKITTGKKHSANSKLSIQGVEKPGGSMKTIDFENINNIRTYARKRKCTSTITIVSEKYDIPTQNIDLCDKNSPNSCNETELCLCDYFGALISYDTENVSENICICRKSKTICTPDIIFSIYYEKSSVATVKEDDLNKADEEYPTINCHENAIYKIMPIDNNGLISAVQKREHDLDDVKTMVQKTNTTIIDWEMMTETTVFCVNQTSENCVDNCDRTTKCNDVNSEPYQIPSTSKETRKSSQQLDGEPPSKKRVLGDRFLRNEIGKESQDDPGIHGTVITNDSVHDEVMGTVEKNLIKCGVCGRYMQSEDWYGHIELAHNYLAWKYGDRELDVDKTEDVRKHLGDLMKEFGGLKCVKCGLIRIKQLKTYMNHIERCNGFSKRHDSTLNDSSESSVTNITNSISDNRTSGETEMINSNIVKCGVCEESMISEIWFSHIGLEHNYLAWKYGEGSLDFSNDEAVREHLYVLAKKLGGLKCSKCGVIRKYVKSYMTHIENCDGLSESQNASALDNLDNTSNISQVEPDNTRQTSTNVIVKNEAVPVNNELVKCGVCDESMSHTNWLSHIESQHQYLAWKCGEPVLDFNDDNVVQDHLCNLTKELLGLRCSKCGCIRKNAKTFMYHIKSCNGLNDTQNEELEASSSVSQIESVKNTRWSSRNCIFKNTSVSVNSELIKCGVCDESMGHNHWFSHIESRHCYLAWENGKPELDMNDEEAVHEHLNEIAKQLGSLKCSKCGLSRKYAKAYLKHIESCSVQNVSTQVTSLEVETEEALGHDISDSVTNESLENEMPHENEAIVQCGVCANLMQNEDWICHIKKEHNYLAWKCGESPLDVDNEEAVREHLHNIMKKCGGLECSKCGISRKYVKSYLSHFNTCDGLHTQERNDDAVNSTQYETLVVAESASSKVDEDLVKCGACGQYMVTVDWIAHLAETHNYLAWKSSDNPLDVRNPVKVHQHLKRLLEELGSLVCSKCGVRRKYVKSYLLHIRLCDGSEESSSDLPLIDVSNSELATEEVITPTAGPVPPTSQCGLCGLIVENSMWISHIVEQHDYLAWKAGETALDVNDKDMVLQHLKRMAKECGALTCKHCGKTKKLAKTYLKHIETCGQDRNVSVDTANVSVDTANVSGDTANVSADTANLSIDTVNVSVDTANSTLDLTESRIDIHSGGNCGVCLQSVKPGRWIHHIQKYHNYLAWRVGEKPLDVEDYTEINENLYAISKIMNGLTCNKCGLTRKYVKVFLTHIKNCAGMDYKPMVNGIGQALGIDYECAMCQQRIEPSQWRKHAMKEHYNVTWIVGQTPIDIKNPNAVEKYIKEYGDRYGLKCTKCGTSRVSTAGFYAHIVTCGKTEEEIEMYKSLCDICNNTYLCIYKNQHIAMHRAQKYSRELKLKKLESQAQKDVKDEEIISGKRRAARKARSVIENYSNDLGKNTYKCESCDFGTEFKEELKSHKCEKTNEEDFSGNESSSGDEEPSGGDSESLLTSEASDEEEPEKKRFRHSVVTSKVPRIPFEVMHRTSYLLQADKDFCNSHFTDDTLFPHWLSCDYEMVAECDLLKYLPPMEQSCKLKSTSNWMTVKRFEAIKDDGISIFVGACIICISWTPLRLEDIEGGTDNYLAVACHNDVDLPRYRCDETLSYGNLIQIWTYNAGKQLPRIVLGVAHDFGTVWSMDWCPSGARDRLPENIKVGQTCRLGLLAVACSNGSAYIFSVPNPCTVVKEDKFVYKLKPVAELRMQMNSDRKLYQATAITWSKEKNHNIILVGYADGSTAYYDLNCDSPLLRKVDNNVDVYYPYHDERPQNSCITATDMYPSALGGGATVSACVTGAELGAARRGAGGGRARYPGACHAAAFAPLWPAALLAGDVAIMRTMVNEVEWATPGRRCGGNSALAGCARCAGVAAAAPPTLRLLRPHPVHPEFNKQVIGLVELTRIDNKKDKKVNDEVAVQIEPLTYADTVKIYGIVFRTARKGDKETQQNFAAKPQAHYPHRFPLADVRSMAFCPSRKYHHHLAIATHSGLLFFINVAL